MLETIIRSIGLGNWLKIGLSTKEVLGALSIIVWIAYIKAQSIKGKSK